MFERRTLFRLYFWGGLALLIVGTGSVSAQEVKKPEDPAFPPNNAQKAEGPFKRKGDNSTDTTAVESKHGLFLYLPQGWSSSGASTENHLAVFSTPGENIEAKLYSSENKDASDTSGTSREIRGGVTANIDHWVNQFDKVLERKVLTGHRVVQFPADSDAAKPLEKGKSLDTGQEDRKYVLVDLTGTKKDGTKSRIWAALIGIQWNETLPGLNTPSQSAVYLIKMEGPADKLTDELKSQFRGIFGAQHPDNENELQESGTETTNN